VRLPQVAQAAVVQAVPVEAQREERPEPQVVPRLVQGSAQLRPV
jgi:hypothetical protein